ncbi:hypothetical protein ACH5RR_040727 [Cinchona calisaya]|uniref:MATH domain-containing protein n=1 Tax=Cinchona calisaya TaxID=153742 RepID=A0ABD2XWV0_9GENT
MAEEKSHQIMPAAVHDCDIVQAVVRKAPPSDYTLKIDSFSFLLEILEKTKARLYNSAIFKASGYKWKLSLYPNGDPKRDGKGYMSIYASIEETSALPRGWEINANIKFFVYDQIRDEYLIFQGNFGNTIRLHEMKKEWGIDQLLDLNIFRDATNGYLFNDKCVFGVEILANRCTGRGECLALPEKICSNYTWKVVKYSKCQKVHYSDAFVLGNFNWKLRLYPKGDHRQEGRSLSLFLQSANTKTAPRVYVEYKICIKNRMNGKDFERAASRLFSPSQDAWGWPTFVSLNDINDSSKGFLANDTLIFQVEITRISTVKNFS